MGNNWTFDEFYPHSTNAPTNALVNKVSCDFFNLKDAYRSCSYAELPYRLEGFTWPRYILVYGYVSPTLVFITMVMTGLLSAVLLKENMTDSMLYLDFQE